MDIFSFLVRHIDWVWIPVAAVVARPHQRAAALFFTVLVIISLQLQIELIKNMGSDTGLVSFWGQSDIRSRGQFIYGLITAFYLLLLWASPRAPATVVLSAGIVLYIAGFTISTVIMAI